MKINFKIFIGFLWIFVCGCNVEVDPDAFNPQELVGEYSANHGKGTDLLKLEKDGSFIQTFKSQNGEKFQNEGTWQYKKVETNGNKAGLVVLRKFVHYWNNERKPIHGSWSIELEKGVSGQIQITIEPEHGYYYEKVD